MNAKTTILIIDDDFTMRKFLRLAIANDDRTVIEADNAIDALHLIKQYSPAIVLLDLGLLGDYSGFTLLDMLRNDPANHKIMVAIISGWNQEVDIARARRLGADSYLIKPVSVKKIVETVDELELGHNAFSVVQPESEQASFLLK